MICRRRGLTLLELMVCSALAALLMGGVLAIVSLLARDRQRLDRRDVASERSAALVSLLRRDLAGASRLEADDEGRRLVLTGYSGIDSRVRRHDNRPARVAYQIRRGDGSQTEASLTRTQEYLDATAGEQPWAELAAIGVETIRAYSDEAEDGRRAEGEDDGGPSSPAPPSLPGRGAAEGGASGLSDRMRLEVTWSDGRVERALVLRR